MDARRILAHPVAYQAFQQLVGSRRQRRLCLQAYIRPISGERVLDCGCGPGDMLNYLPSVDYVGIDIDPHYIEAARRAYGHRAEFRLGGVGPETIGESSQYDLVLAWGLLHHLPDDDASQFLDCARRALKPTGRFVSLDGCYHKGQSRIARWLLERDRGQFVRSLESWHRLLRGVFPSVEVNLRQDLLRIPYSQVVIVARPKLDAATIVKRRPAHSLA